MDDDRIINLAWDCINKHKERYQEDICDPKHKEVEEMKSKVNKIYVLLIVACLALIGNLVAYMAIPQEHGADGQKILEAIQDLNATMKVSSPGS